MLNNNDMLMDWDDAIENDGQEFYILPEGDYNFTVVDFVPFSGVAHFCLLPLHRSEETR